MIDTKIKNKSVQKDFGWCAIHCLINMFDSDTNNYDFSKYLNHKETKGCNDEKIKEIMSEECPKIGMSWVAKLNQSYGRFPRDFVWNSISRTDVNVFKTKNISKPLSPFILSTESKIHKGYFHAVNVYNYNGLILVSDPTWETLKIVESQEDFFSCVGEVVEIDKPYFIETQRCMIFNGEKFNYSKNL